MKYVSVLYGKTIKDCILYYTNTLARCSTQWILVLIPGIFGNGTKSETFFHKCVSILLLILLLLSLMSSLFLLQFFSSLFLYHPVHCVLNKRSAGTQKTVQNWAQSYIDLRNIQHCRSNSTGWTMVFDGNLQYLQFLIYFINKNYQTKLEVLQIYLIF